MMIYQRLFAEYNQVAGQVLMTKNTMVNPVSRENAKNTFDELFRLGAIPIVNENDTVSTYEMQWSSQDKFMVVLETANLTEIEFSEYCREKGIYPEQVKEWKEACINANDNAREKSTKVGKELRVERKEKEKLEKELARKEKALAEAAALLVLRKKADAIWGTDEEDE